MMMTTVFVIILSVLSLIHGVNSNNWNSGYKRFINYQDLTSIFSKKLTDFDLFSLGTESDLIKKQIELSQKSFEVPICALFFNDQIEKISTYQAPFPWPSSFTTSINDSKGNAKVVIDKEEEPGFDTPFFPKNQSLNVKSKLLSIVTLPYRGVRKGMRKGVKIIKRVFRSYSDSDTGATMITYDDKDNLDLVKAKSKEADTSDSIVSITIEDSSSEISVDVDVDVDVEWQRAVSAFDIKVKGKDGRKHEDNGSQDELMTARAGDMMMDTGVDMDVNVNMKLALIHSCMRLCMATYNLNLASPISTSSFNGTSFSSSSPPPPSSSHSTTTRATDVRDSGSKSKKEIVSYSQPLSSGTLANISDRPLFSQETLQWVSSMSNLLKFGRRTYDKLARDVDDGEDAEKIEINTQASLEVPKELQWILDIDSNSKSSTEALTSSSSSPPPSSLSSLSPPPPSSPSSTTTMTSPDGLPLPPGALRRVRRALELSAEQITRERLEAEEKARALAAAITPSTAENVEVDIITTTKCVCILVHDVEAGVFTVAFRGTREPLDVVTDIDFIADILRPQTLYEINPIELEVHAGFLRAFTSVRPALHERLLKIPKNTQVVFTGHSLGGALSTLAAACFAPILSRTPVLLSFGAPAAGGESFVKFVDSHVAPSGGLRFFNNGDLVPYLALPVGYKHAGLAVPSDISEGAKQFYQDLASDPSLAGNLETIAPHILFQLGGVLHVFPCMGIDVSRRTSY